MKPSIIQAQSVEDMSEADYAALPYLSAKTKRSPERNTLNKPKEQFESQIGEYQNILSRKARNDYIDTIQDNIFRVRVDHTIWQQYSTGKHIEY